MNDEARMTKDEGRTKDGCQASISSFVIHVSSFFRHSSFVIRHYLSCALIVLIPSLLSAADAEKNAAQMVTPAAQKAIERGTTWLAGRQHEDGSFGAGAYRGNTGVTALAGMAFLAGGSTPGRGPHGAQVSRAVDYLLAATQPSGFVAVGGVASHGPMYGHGFATMFLAECYGMAPRPELREKLAKAVKLIVNAQNKDGGWRYQPQRADADVSVTACEMMALRAARNAGIFVPNETRDRGVEFVKRCQNADGGFMYMVQGGESSFPRSAAAVAALYSAAYEGPEIAKGQAYLQQFLPAEGVLQRENYFYYGHYYAVQAAWQAGGETWRRWYPAVRDELLSRQHQDGSWTSPIDVDADTAMALVTLEMPKNYVPIFQK